MMKLKYIEKFKLMKYTKLVIGIVIGILIAGISIYYASTIYYQSTDVGYDNTMSGMSATTVQDAIDELACVNTPFNTGDYFIMQPDASIASTSYAGFSGFQPTNLFTLWTVINVKSNGQIEAVPIPDAEELDSVDGIEITGIDGYKNCIAGLQDIASKYAKSGYTVATRAAGYNGQTLVLSDTSAFNGSSTTPPSTISTYDQPDYNTLPGSEYDNGVLGDSLMLNDWVLLQKYLHNNDLIFANRSYGYEGDDYYEFSCHRSVRYYADNQWYDADVYGLVYPVITLRSGITIASGSGTEIDPYILN